MGLSFPHFCLIASKQYLITTATQTLHLNMPIYAYYYLPCPLCLQDVDQSQPDFYRVLPLDSAYAKLINERPHWEPGVLNQIIVGDLTLISYQDYPRLRYTERAWLLHTRCLDFVRDLSSPKLYLLMDLVEPTFLSRSLRPASKYGAFHSHQPCQTLEVIATPCPWRHFILEMIRSLWNSLCRLPWERKRQLPLGLPREIWDMVQEYDIGRLLFVMKTASQLKRLDVGPTIISKQRFTVRRLTLKSDFIRIHFINIGGRTYIRHLTDPKDNRIQSQAASSPFVRAWRRAIAVLHFLMGGRRASGVKSLDYRLNGSKYLAVKSDGIGIIDIAFRDTEAGPEWILNNRTTSAVHEISKVRYAKVRDLIIIYDVWALSYCPSI